MFVVINRAPGLKRVVETLLSSVQSIGNIMVICFVIFMIFSILGVQVCLTKMKFMGVIDEFVVEVVQRKVLLL